jgi:hypothetical protein
MAEPAEQPGPEPASVHPGAGSLLTKVEALNSAAFSRGFCSVADPSANPRLPVRLLEDLEQHSANTGGPPPRQPHVRACSSVD